MEDWAANAALLDPAVDYSVAEFMDDRWRRLPEPQSRLCTPVDYVSPTQPRPAL